MKNVWVFMAGIIMTMLFASSTVPVGYAASQAATISTRTFNQTIQGYHMDLEYPEVVMQDNVQAGQRISMYFRPDAALLEQEYKNMPEGNIVGDTRQRFTVQANDGKYLSFVINQGIMPRGAAHAIYAPKGLTFDAATGTSLKWQDVIQEQDAAAFSLAGINEAIAKSDAAAQGKLYKDFQGLKDFPSQYYIAPDGDIHFLFDPYYIGPFASGVIDINMHKKAK